MSYWKTRLEEKLNKSYDITLANINRRMGKEYKRTAEKLVKEMEALYLKLMEEAEDGVIRANDFYRYNRMYEQMGNINKQLSALGMKQLKIIEPELEAEYLRTSIMVGDLFPGSVEINIRMAREAVMSIWCADGKSWSTRLWDDKALLTEDLREGLFDSVARGVSHRELTKTLMQHFKQSYSRAERLVRTELCHVQTQATLQRYIENGITAYDISDAGDYPGSGEYPERECMECHELAVSGPYLIANAVPGENLPPIHPNCRCAIIPHLDIKGYFSSMEETELKNAKKELQIDALEMALRNAEDEISKEAIRKALKSLR